jgi:predicted O-methyltransferase YrrM
VQLVDPDAERYALEHTTPLPAQLQAALDEAHEALPYPSMLSGATVGRLLETLVFALGARLVLEVGTYAGTSALAMAAGLAPGGRIISLEIDEAHAEFARRHIAASQHADCIEVRVGPALDAIAALPGPFDFVFIDADKESYPAYYEAVLPKLSPRGLIAADNTLRDGEVLDAPGGWGAGTRAIAAFNDALVRDERVIAVLLTVRDGVTLIRPRG